MFRPKESAAARSYVTKALVTALSDVVAVASPRPHKDQKGMEE
jgi:hypothetical protein